METLRVGSLILVISASANVHAMRAPCTSRSRGSIQSSSSSVTFSRRGVLASAAALPFATFLQAAPAQAATLDEAQRAFQRGDYEASEKLWREVANANPDQSLAWSNLGVTLVINASGDMQLGVPPTGKARERLDEALVALDKAIAIDGEAAPDALTLNSRGNALGLLLRWEEAAKAYGVATAASRRDFVSIPRSNQALALFELGSLGEAERQARTLIRRDPNFRDGAALLATLRYEQGDLAGATSAVNMLCSGEDGAGWCRRYSTVDVVLGRWSPKAVDAYTRLLKEPSVQLELKNAQSLPGRGSALPSGAAAMAL